MICQLIHDLKQQAAMTVTRACALAGMPRPTFYRISRGYQHYQPVDEPVPHRQRRQPAALTDAEKEQVVDALCDPAMEDRSVVQAYWSTLDEGKIACSRPGADLPRAERLRRRRGRDRRDPGRRPWVRHQDHHRRRPR